MAGKTILELSAAASFGATDRLLTRLNGETADRSLLGSVLTTYLDTLYQPLDSELTALAGLTSAADKLPYFTGSGTASLTDLTTFGRSLIDDASADAALTTLGVTAFAKTILDDADADTALSTLGVSTYAKTILDDTSASAARITLGLGDVAVLNEISESDLSAAVQTKLNNTAPSKFDATAAPTANDDASNTAGNGTFAVGSVWIDVTNDEAYRCVDATATAAVWINTTLTTSELGTIATQDASSVNITGGSITGITDLAVADGGTGASNASDARTNLGVAIGSDVQAYDADLAAIAALANTDGNIIVGNGSTWVAESGNTARTSLGLGTGDSPQFSGVNIGNATDTTITRSSAGVIAVEGSNVLMASNLGSTVQAYDAGLQSIAGLTTAADRMIYTTAADTYAVATLTSFARTLLDDADAATARTTLDVYSQSEVDALAANLDTVVSVSSGTSQDFTIPSGAKVVQVIINAVQTSGTDVLAIQLGDSGGIETSGYVYNTSNDGGTIHTTNSAQFDVVEDTGAGADDVYHVIATLILVDPATNTWVISSQYSETVSTYTGETIGSKSLTGELTTVRIKTEASNTFTAGKLNVLTQG